MDKEEMTIRAWLDLLPTRKGYYRECEIIDSTPIGTEHVFITIKIPLPVGGEGKDVVPMSTIILVERGN
jgi:hypothetical protein